MYIWQIVFLVAFRILTVLTQIYNMLALGEAGHWDVSHEKSCSCFRRHYQAWGAGLDQ
jgi:hypothetical protein